MKKWTKEIEIEAPIEHVWKYLNGSLEDMQKIMPQVVSNETVTITEGMVGSIYLQKYREGKRVMEYEVETLDYFDSPDEKKMKVGFTLGGMFEITAGYKLYRINDEKTRFTYTTTNKPLKWFIKLFVLFANDKPVVEFVERVKRVAEVGI
ncbi:SRPBCC family protein [Sporosarcina thermotolerans]|uniref:SRPBCC family protein n=1 Tax=Sporosarcina thermotolerans TaxID=633404 RepID=A0AAW9A4V8_9BACL|nr:SRPBCC family protein [Sporosarcina thermotolerans]MDW0115957.1 SRPBCC family protein [Sporosarcina thermotolerans]WHT46835.1 SRPBCC family protein [Sporosarcina thermotolerans]